MAAPTAAQKAAAEKAAEDRAAEEKAAEDRAAEEKTAADRTAAEQPSGTNMPSAESESELEQERDLYLVTGAAVVLRTDDGFERYLYRGAIVDGAAFSQSSIDHAISNGLIAETE